MSERGTRKVPRQRQNRDEIQLVAGMIVLSVTMALGLSGILAEQALGGYYRHHATEKLEIYVGPRVRII